MTRLLGLGTPVDGPGKPPLEHRRSQVARTHRPVRARESWAADAATNTTQVVWVMGVASFNRTASFIWELCDGTRSVERIVDHARDAFQHENAENLERELVTFLQAIADLGLVYLTDPALDYDELPLVRRVTPTDSEGSTQP